MSLSMADVLARFRAHAAAAPCTGAETAPRTIARVGTATGCRWIEGDDYLLRALNGHDVYCGRPVRRPGEAWCSEHRERVYFTPGSAAHEAELTADFTPAERGAYGQLRANGLSLLPAIAVIVRHRRRQTLAVAA